MEFPFSLPIYGLLLLMEATLVLPVRPALTVTCKVNRDCNWQALCWNGRCEKAKPSDRGDCISDNDCSKGDGCRFGICFTLFDIPAINKTDKPEIDHEGCRGDKDCPKHHFCVGSRCVEGEPSNEECKNDSDCRGRGICWDQLCWDRPGKSADDTPRDGQCSSHDDCDGDMLCHEVEKECKAGVLAVDCETSDDCGRNAFCKGSKCLKFAPECAKQEDCKGKKLCDKGRCVDGEKTRKKCTGNSPCPNNEKCKFSYCWKLKGKMESEDEKEPSKDAKPKEEKKPSEDTKPKEEKKPTEDAKPKEEKEPQQADDTKPKEEPNAVDGKNDAKPNETVAGA